jgi:hypothetical protein
LTIKDYIILVGQAMSSVIKTVPATLETYAIYLSNGYAMLSLCSLIKGTDRVVKEHIYYHDLERAIIHVKGSIQLFHRNQEILLVRSQ